MTAPSWTFTPILNQLSTGNLWFVTQITYSFDFIAGAGTTNVEFGYTTTRIDFAHSYCRVWFNSTENVLFNPTIG